MLSWFYKLFAAPQQQDDVESASEEDRFAYFNVWPQTHVSV